MTTSTTTPSARPTTRGRRARLRLRAWVCRLLHRPQWYAPVAADGKYYGDAGAETWRCRSCGRKWKRAD